MSRTLQESRRRYAAAICREAGVTSPTVKRAFATVPRESFLTPPPWTIFSPGGMMEASTSDPVDLYQDVLVVLDRSRGINNGQPSLHAAWLAAVAPGSGDGALQIGAGTGYYTALLAELVGPKGGVEAYEIEEELAALAMDHLAAFPQVNLQARSGIGPAMPEADVIYVNAGLSAPDPTWLRALRPGGRLIFPWQPSEGRAGVAMLVTRLAGGFSALPIMPVRFIPCLGIHARAGSAERTSEDAIWRTKSVWLSGERMPDATATSVDEAVWFSSEPV